MRYRDTTNAAGVYIDGVDVNGSGLDTNIKGVTVTASALDVHVDGVDVTGSGLDVNLKGVTVTGSQLRTISTPYTYQIAEGNISGHERFRLLGYNADVDAAEETVWNYGGIYTFPPSAQTLEVISDNSYDCAGSNGARTVTIQYLDATYREKSTTVTMAGSTAVATSASDIYRINRLDVVTAGSANAAVGNIDVRETDDSPIYGRINAGRVREAMSVYTVPAGKKLYITGLYTAIGGSGVGKYGEFRWKANTDYDGNSTGAIMRERMLMLVEDGGTQVQFTVPIPVSGCVDMRVDVKGNATNENAVCSVEMGGWEETV